MRRLAALALVVLVACGHDARAAAPVTVAIARDRAFDVVGALQLAFVNDGDSTVEVTGVELRTALFAPLGPADRDVTVPGGRRVTMPLRYGDARCEPGADDELVVRFRAGGTSYEESAGPASLAIQRLHAAACAAQAVHDAVDVGFGDGWHVEDGTKAVGPITVRPKGDADAELRSVTSSIVFVTRPVTPLPATGDVEVEATAARCDAHALTESKKTFLFLLSFSIDGGEPVNLELRATGDVLRVMNEAIDACVAARVANG